MTIYPSRNGQVTIDDHAEIAEVAGMKSSHSNIQEENKAYEMASLYPLEPLKHRREIF